MKSKRYLIIISIIVIIIVIVLSYSYYVKENNFIDNGTSSKNNDDWTNNLNVSRNTEFTTLSSHSKSSLWHIANHKSYGDFIVEWDNHGKPNMQDYCLISNEERTADSPVNFINDLNITKDCHVKLVIKNNTITPYVDGLVKDSVPLVANPKEGLMFRFQINPNGSDISYSNFKIQTI